MRKTPCICAAVMLHCAAGCHSLYHTTMIEMAQPMDEVIDKRLDDALAMHHSAAEAVQRSSGAMRRDSPEQHVVARHLNIAQRDTWNAQRHRAALRDRGDEYAVHSETQAACDAVLHAMRDVQDALYTAIATLEQEWSQRHGRIDAPRADTDRALRELDEQLRTLDHRAAHLRERNGAPRPPDAHTRRSGGEQHVATGMK